MVAAIAGRTLLARRTLPCPVGPHRRAATILGAVRPRPWLVALLVLARLVRILGGAVRRLDQQVILRWRTAATACGPAGATTLAATAGVRVYALRPGRVRLLARREAGASAWATRRASIAEARVGPVAVAGDLAAYGLSSFGVDTVRAVGRGAAADRRHSSSSSRPPRRSEPSRSSRWARSSCRPDGAVAWIGSRALDHRPPSAPPRCTRRMPAATACSTRGRRSTPRRSGCTARRSPGRTAARPATPPR